MSNGRDVAENKKKNKNNFEFWMVYLIKLEGFKIEIVSKIHFMLDN